MMLSMLVLSLIKTCTMHILFLRKSSILVLTFFIQYMTCVAQEIPALAPNHLVLPVADQRIPFTWQGDSLGNTWNPHAAQLIPVKLENCPRPFYMQFDLGSPSSMFYKNKLRDIAAKYPGAIAWNDSLKKIDSFHFTAGNTKVFAEEIGLINLNGKIDWNKNVVEIIGTIGADFIDNRIAVINYPEKYILLSNDMVHTKRISLAPFLFARRAVLLPATLHGKTLMLYFDTGSSAFELLTSKETALSLAAPGAVATQYPVRSWNNTLIANTLPTHDSITIGEQTIPLVATTYVDNVKQTMIDQMLKMGIGGMTGNKLFLDYILILDTKNRKFGIKKE
jgi:hypothetical protein